MTVQILIVDDEQPIRESLSGLFEDEGYLVSTAPSGEEAVVRFRKNPVDCIFLDIWMPGIDGLETMSRIKQINPDVPIIVMSGHATIDTAVRATKLGAFDFIEKPFSSEKLLILLRNAIEKRRLALENFDLKIESQQQCPQMIGDSVLMTEVRKNLAKASRSDFPVLLLGEHGVGKSVAARLLHESSGRKSKSFVDVNPTLIGKEHVERELFGYEKGSFAGALQTRRGRLEAAHRGTVYFEEITAVPMDTQLQLLAVMQQRRVTRQGNVRPAPCDIRVIAGSSYAQADLERSESLAKELYAQFHVLILKIPSLKQRPEDIPMLLSFLAADQAVHLGGKPVSFADEVVDLLQDYGWPGNVRELRNYVERCHILCSGKLFTVQTMLPLDTLSQPTLVEAVAVETDDAVLMDGFHDARKRFEENYIMHHLEKHDWNVSKTAADIGMERSQLHRKIKSYGLRPSHT